MDAVSIGVSGFSSWCLQNIGFLNRAVILCCNSVVEKPLTCVVAYVLEQDCWFFLWLLLSLFWFDLVLVLIILCIHIYFKKWERKLTPVDTVQPCEQKFCLWWGKGQNFIIWLSMYFILYLPKAYQKVLSIIDVYIMSKAIEIWQIREEIKKWWPHFFCAEIPFLSNCSNKPRILLLDFKTIHDFLTFILVAVL